MSTKTTFKRIALVAVAALGFGVLSVVPSQANVSAVDVVVANASVTQIEAADTTTATVNSDSTTAGSVTVTGLLDAVDDTITVGMILKSHPTGGETGAGKVRLIYADTTTATTTTAVGKAIATTDATREESITAGSSIFSISHTSSGYVGARFRVQADSATAGFPAGAYVFTIVVKAYSQGALSTPVTTTKDVTITVAAKAVVVKVPAAANAKAIMEAGNPTNVTSITDSVTAGSFATAATPIGKIKVTNADSADAAAKDTITVTMTGPGYLTSGSSTGRSFSIPNVEDATFSIFADGTSGTGTITIKTVAGASFVKTVTFFDTKPVTAVTTVAKAFIKAGTGSVKDVFATTVKDTLGNVITDGGVTVTAAPTDTATTVGGAAVCAWNVKGAAYHCEVAGKAADKFGPVAYTITITGTGINLLTTLKTTATVTFADNVATKAVLAGPATGTPGASVDYTLTLTEKNGYPVADQTYGATSEGGAIFSTTAADRVVSGWATAPFSASESFTSKSGVITSAGVLAIAGTATGSWTLIGDGIASSGAIDKTIGKTKVTVSTDITNPGVDAATDAANEATDAANAATDAALAAAEAADAATTAAQEASDAVAALSESVTKLIAGLQSQIKSLAAVVAKIAKKVKA
jgi:hypothetical protein